ncbi:MAG: hypothetical protein ACXWC6_03160 [Ramlibacter sp.]
MVRCTKNNQLYSPSSWIARGASLVDAAARWSSAVLGREGSKRRLQDPAPFAYRLRRWPDLPDHLRKASVLQSLARMSCSPVSHRWFLSHCGLARAAAEGLLASLAAKGELQRIDISHLGRSA